MDDTGKRPDSVHKSYARNYDRLGTLKERVEVLHEFSEHANKLNNFRAFYEEPKKDDINYARETAEYYGRQFNEEDEFQTMKSWQKEEFGNLKSAKTFLEKNKEHPLQSVLSEKIAQIEDRVLDGNRIRQFYDDFRDGKIEFGKLASECNALVTHLKSIEKWLRKNEPNFSIEKNAFSRRIWRENVPYGLSEESAKEILSIKKNPTNEHIEENLQTYVGKHPESRIEHYRGIPYIADQKGAPAVIE